jgi:hypothetical protein
MQSVSLNKFLSFPRSAWSRRYPYLFIASLMALALLLWARPCSAQNTPTAPTAPTAPTVPEFKEKYDLGLGGFYQVTNASNGNFIREDTTESGGALVSFRQPYRPWVGYEANLGYTRFSEAYNKGVVKLANNVTDFSLAYLFQSPTVYGVQPFASVGVGIIVFSPMGTITDLNAVTPPHFSSQLLPEFVYSLGLNYPILGRFGVRGQLRGLKYKTPDFGQVSLDSHKLRNTLEPTFSVYYRF